MSGWLGVAGRTAVAAGVTCLALAALTGCDSGQSSGLGSATPATTVATPGSCPTTKPETQHFPRGLPSRLPRPSIATSPTYLPTGDKRVSLLQFTTQMSIRDAVLFVLKAYPAAGYLLGRGDAEIGEADTPFANGKYAGTTRLTVAGPCTTTWLVATITARGDTSYPVPNVAPYPASPNPLPFG